MSDLMPIKSNAKTVQACFKECLYEVPVFQRPYSWSEAQLGDYWNDVVLAQSDFFFGSTVTWLSEKRELFNDTFSLIDGQQRLTTSAIALSVMRDSFARLQQEVDSSTSSLYTHLEEQGRVTQSYLVVKDDDGNEYPVIKRAEQMFWDVILQPSAIPAGGEWGQSARRIGQARSFFEKKVGEALATHLTHEHQFEQLKRLRNNILKARVIQVELASEEDGFLIFETLNTRGADLRLADLIKNMLVRGIGRGAQDKQAVANRWDRLAGLVAGGSDEAEAIDEFVWQSWNSRREAVKVSELYKSAKTSFAGSPKSHLSFLEELEGDAKRYQLVAGLETNFPNSRRDRRHALAVPRIKDSIRALNLFNVSVANSAILSLLRKFDECPYVKEADLVDAMWSIEKFHFQFTQLTKSGSTGGTRGRYNRFAVQLESAQNRVAVVTAIQELKNRLRESLPSRERAVNGFMDTIYAPALELNRVDARRGRAALVRYIFLTMARHEGALPPAQDAATWTIEHIRPQKLASEMVDDATYNVGNLMLLTDKINQSAADGSFHEKRPLLQEKAAFRDTLLLQWLSDPELQELTDEHIRVRSSTLAGWAIDEVWSI